MRHVKFKLVAVSTCALLLAAAAWNPAWAEDLGSAQEAKQDEGFFDGMADDAGDFFSDVGDFFADDVGDFFSKDGGVKLSDEEKTKLRGEVEE